MDPLIAVADHFNVQDQVLGVQPYGNGNVHDTFLVTLNGLREKKFILQRINTRVFPQPELVLQNIRAFTSHVHRQPRPDLFDPDRRWEFPHLLMTKEGRDHWIDANGSFWRAISFIDRARSFDTIQHSGHAQEVGYALGLFHRLVSDLPLDQLADTLIGFHITPGYLQRYDEVLGIHEPEESPEIKYGLRFITRQRPWANLLEEAKAYGQLHLRPIHGDPKVNNVLIDFSSHQAVSLIDLDTIKPGLIHYDIGDCLRSCCNPLGEDTPQWEAVRFEPEICRAILKGYLPMAGSFLLENDYAYLYAAIRLIAFELGLRFFTDYLEGNVYFKVGYEAQNLMRALVQFKLTESIESQAADIRAVIQDMR